MNTETKAPALTFDTLLLEKPGAGEAWSTVTISGNVWNARYFDSAFQFMNRELTRKVSGGNATITAVSNDEVKGYWLTIIPLECEERYEGDLKHGSRFPTLAEAVDAAEHFEWAITDHAGVRWFQTTDTEWVAALDKGDRAIITRSSTNDGTFHVSRKVSPREGELYEIRVNFYDTSESKRAVKTFSEAAAIALTLPMYLANLVKHY